MNARKYEMSLEFDSDTNKLIEKLCEDGHMSKSDLFRKSLALMMVALNHKKNGHHLAALDNNDKKISEIIGI